MKKYCYFLLFPFLLLACQYEKSNQGLTSKERTIQYVDPFIGTGFHGHTFPGATLPFGMVQLSPDTRLPGWDASSGYHYSDSTIYGFSHTHLSGTGIGDMGDILFLPFTGQVQDTLIGQFKKESEKAKVGYYQVTLDNFGVKAELTATTRTGMHRYHFPKEEAPKLLIDLGHILQANWGHKSLVGELEIIDNQTIKGKRVSSGWANDHPVYFYATFSQPFELIQAKDRQQVVNGQRLSGKELKVWLEFPKMDSQELLVKTGISVASELGAQENLAAENPNWNFEETRQQAEKTWEKALSKIVIKTPHETVKTNFYTALYHSMVAPMVAQDVNGQYRGMDKQIHEGRDSYKNYTVYSLWDTFRALHPLMSILDRQRTNEWINNLLGKYQEGGVLPKWPLASNYTGTMVGYPSVALIADALAKGINDFDVNLALEAAVVSSNYHPEITEKIAEPRGSRVLSKHFDYIEKLGFIPADSINNSVSYGLECAYYDWCIAQIARHAGNKEIERRYLERSKFYQKYFDSSIGFMRGKLSNGEWRKPFNPYFSDHEHSEFVEGNSWQWMWFVPHDIDGYIQLVGGQQAFAAKLDELFSADSTVAGENASGDITGLIGQYAHGNEPSHHVTHFYNYVGQSNKTQTKVDEVLQTFYTTKPDGIIGNEDCGAMSAWYVLNTLGFYQVCPGKPTYSLGRPLIEEAIINLENGKSFKIIVENNSLANKYIGEVQLNDEVLEQSFFEHSAIEAGGVLKFRMQSNPD